MDQAARMAKFKATMARKRAEKEAEAIEDARSREWVRRAVEEREERLRAIGRAAAQAKPTLATALFDYTLSEDGSLGHIKMRVTSEPRCCAFAHFDRNDMDRLASYLVYGFRRGDLLKPHLGGGAGLNGRDYWSVGRMLLEIDDPAWRVIHLNGNLLDNRKQNLAAYRVGSFPVCKNYGPGWFHVRRQAWARSGGVCEACRRQAATDVHHRIPAKFFRRPEDANYLLNLLVVCERCHRIEHRKLHFEMPLFYGLVLPTTARV